MTMRVSIGNGNRTRFTVPWEKETRQNLQVLQIRLLMGFHKKRAQRIHTGCQHQQEEPIEPIKETILPKIKKRPTRWYQSQTKKLNSRMKIQKPTTWNRRPSGPLREREREWAQNPTAESLIQSSSSSTGASAFSRERGDGKKIEQ